MGPPRPPWEDIGAEAANRFVGAAGGGPAGRLGELCVGYPRVLFTTSTRDDRVHPGHARKMVAKMTAQGHDVLYYENVEGGHAGATDNRQAAYMSALAYTFLLRELR